MSMEQIFYIIICVPNCVPQCYFANEPSTQKIATFTNHRAKQLIV